MRLIIASAMCVALLASQLSAQCCGDCDGDGQVAINELITSVNKALNGCTDDGRRLVDNDDGSLTDRLTGLMWEKKDGSGCRFASEQGCLGDETTLGELTVHDLQTCFTACVNEGADVNACNNERGGIDGGAVTILLATLNGGAGGGCFAGHCDWRLPTIDELMTFPVDEIDPADCPFTGDSPNQVGCHDVTRPDCNCHWVHSDYMSGTTDPADSNRVLGASRAHPKGACQAVRAVRRDP